jgi:hypothetical protein
VDVQLQLSVMPPPLTDDSFDVCIRFGEPPDARVIARRLAPTGGCCAPRRPTWRRACRRRRMTWPAQLHRHPPGRRGLWGVALSPGSGASRKTETVKCAAT